MKRIFKILEQFLDAHPVGELFLPDTPFLLSREDEPPTLRGPDLAYLRSERAGRIDEKQRIQGAPDLAIEVVSPPDSAPALLEKTAQYLAAGAHAVWVVYPDDRQVRVFEASGAMRILGERDRIDAPALLPGFSAPVSAFFGTGSEA